MSFDDERTPERMHDVEVGVGAVLSARLSRSLRMLQRSFGQRHGKGDQVMLFHALQDLLGLSAEIEQLFSSGVERVKRISLGSLRDEQAKQLWRSIEAITAGGARVVLEGSQAEVVMPSGEVHTVLRKTLADAAAHVIGRLVIDLNAAGGERAELVERLVEGTEPMLSPERDLGEAP